MLHNDTFLKALMRQPTEHTPVWLMRQAGRYLPEYRATRAKAGDFMSLCRSAELACEVTLQPIDRYNLDAAILFSDILTVPDAMGLGLYFAEGEGPKFKTPLRDEAQFANLPIPDPNVELRYVMNAVSTIKGALNNRVPLIGFTGSPWTLACYMVEGAGSHDDFRHTRAMMYKRPDLMHKLLETLTQSVGLYLAAQIEAGADAVMVFDSWGGLLPAHLFETFSAQYIRKVLQMLPEGKIVDGQFQKVPKIVFVKGGGQWLEQTADTGADALGLDWTTDLATARARVGDRCALQGNLDPIALFGSPESIVREAKATLDAFGKPQAGVGHIFNLGHGISQHTPPENVSILVDTVHAYSRQMRA